MKKNIVLNQKSHFSLNSADLKLNNQQLNNSLVVILKEDRLVLKSPLDVLQWINKLDIVTSLDESYYVKHEIKKRNGSIRILNEPKPNLKLVQKKLLELIDCYVRNNKAVQSYKSKLIDGVSAYRKNKSVIDNANFHIGQEFVLKLDIKDFFNKVDTSKLQVFWVELLKQVSPNILNNHVFETTLSSNLLEESIQSLATKLVYITSLNFHLAQGSPTSGALANYYLTNFDNRLLNYSIKRKFNYSRYSDDITLSGNIEDLHMGNVLGAIQYMLKERKLSLNKKKTKLLHSNRKQIVTGIVVNVKKTAGREYKRTIRQEVYFLKKFKEEHIAKKEINSNKYIENLLGKISWVYSIQKDDNEFKRYKGELQIINRFLKSGKSIHEALDYLSKLVELTNHLNSEEKLVIQHVEWKKEDEICKKVNYTIGIYTQLKKGENRTYFDEVGLNNYVSNLKDGWRLPTIQEFKNYLQETNYDDRKLLGLTLPSDPKLNGMIQMNRSHLFNKLGGYWASDMQLIPQNSTEFAIGRTVFLSFSKKIDIPKTINGKMVYLAKSSAFSSSNLKKPVIKNAFKNHIDDLVVSENNSSFLQSFSLRLVRNTQSTSEKVVNTQFSESFWDSVAKYKRSANLTRLGIESIPLNSIKEWKSSNLLLSDNKFREGLSEYPPVLKVDFRNNLLRKFDFKKIPKTVRHLLLDGNQELEVSEIPIKQLASHLHELTVPQQFEKQLEINFPDIYTIGIKDSLWIEIDSDEKLAALTIDTENVKHLKINIQIGGHYIDTQTLFDRLKVFVNLVSLHILIEPKEEVLRTFLNQLKMKSSFTKEDLTFIENVKKTNPNDGSECLTDLQLWLYGKLNFVSTELVNKKLKNLIFDFTWFHGIHFQGDFNLELERYHILHPGSIPSNLPSTSSFFHQPNILVKALGQKIEIKQVDQTDNSICELPKLFYILPFNPVSIYYVFNDLFSLYPNNQRFAENIILVLTNWIEKEIPKGKISLLFSKSEKYKNYSKIFGSSFQESRSIFNFPLLGYSLNFDVYKLSNPTKTILFKSEIKENHFVLKYIEHPFGLTSSCLCYFNKSYINNYDGKFSTDNKNSLSINNYLLVQHIFPKLNLVSVSKNDYRLKESVKHTQFKILNRYYSTIEFPENIHKEEIKRILNETNLNPLQLPKKYLKDKDIMLTAIQNNPFSILYAHKGLVQDEDFILKALKTSIRTLIFLDRYLLNTEKGKKIVESVYTYLSSIFTPVQFNYIVNQLNKKIVVSDNETFHFFKFDAKNSSNATGIVKSFEDEMIWWESTKWFSMSKDIRDKLIELAEKHSFFNKDGYFTHVDFSESENCTYLDLSYQDLSNTDENKLAELSTSKRLNIKTLNLSFTRLDDFDLMNVFPSCEVLYLDGLNNLYFNSNNLNEKFPKLKRLYIRSILSKGFEMSGFYDECLNLEFIDARTKESKDSAINYSCVDGRKIIILGINI